ncbi:tetraacyldisaccharide 4'-kinase [Leptospira gomenensis]|uniref:Tetraacyldisaccharide 4'-kinase n=1 Tax=Leptospira gomenensis TaxID=2484974 RepID=A0A5F1YXU7_9LEPT|nr:tetraacyldisaccharide 4'-kinase [Leptospira gomenensis]TGK34948.1 tetraacyldisaccharide 4'-kinase [Leptospira gomenensis]TGK36744.1 tetraacyldisaccharide 4'-kinase [Leptospira gomenensis]TGK48851.1 tetraacyldisaccharide 4'-kinase [Leptospira gomenensis]TGK64617.1 tetraacyldisaccharide 4'-kinase [Leptospira gomenensis]
MKSFNLFSLFQTILFPLLYALSFLYRGLFWLDRKSTSKKRLPGAFVISVGNLSMGGTGKTPFSIFLAKLIHREFPEIPIVVLSRGYGSTGSKNGLRVTIKSTPREAGDEPLLLKKHLPFAEIWIGKDRYSAFVRFKKEYLSREKTIVILDDGFQHHVLDRDVDIVLLDSSKIHKERFLIPAGNLREPISSLSRADWIVFSKYETSAERTIQNVKRGFSGDVLRFTSEPGKLLSPELTVDSPRLLYGKKVYAFTGIGNPEVFFSMIRGFHPVFLETRTFRDHHSYTMEDEAALRTISKNFDYLICTEKDLIKLSQPPENLRTLFLESKLDKEERLLSSLRERIAAWRKEDRS